MWTLGPLEDFSFESLLDAKWVRRSFWKGPEAEQIVVMFRTGRRQLWKQSVTRVLTVSGCRLYVYMSWIIAYKSSELYSD